MITNLQSQTQLPSQMYYTLTITGFINSNVHVMLTAELQFHPFSTTIVRKPLCIVTCQPSIHVAFDCRVRECVVFR